MDLVLKLRELRRMKGLSQLDVAAKSGIGVKTLSSFETGQRIESIKLSQLCRILDAYGVTLAEFFGGAVDLRLEATVPGSTECTVMDAVRKVSKFPSQVQRVLAQRINDIVAGAEVTFH